ncbi:MAG TPA: GntR family transcriptional regulator [Roseomonas sp.]|jgi:DNA-binding GntR family transcriptional regulator
MADTTGKTATAAVHEALRADIGRGRLRPGAPLRQDHIAAQLGVSHVPVREALTLLVCEGLAASRLHRGTTVSALSEAEALELAEYRGLLEGQLTRLAVPNLSRADLARAEAALDALERATELDQIVALNAGFHAILHARAERPFFLRAVDTARLNLGRYLRLTWEQDGNAERSQAEHRQLLAFCAAGEAEAAAALMTAHVRATGQRVAAIIRRDGQSHE